MQVEGESRAGAFGPSLRVLVLGATGYIGRAVARELAARGHAVVAVARARSGIGAAHDEAAVRARLAPCEVRIADVADPPAAAAVFAGERFDVVVSCLASRSGLPADAWRVDYGANRDVLTAARASGVRRFALLSAICVQRPRLAFQHAKLAFEAELAASGLEWSIVRPTAFFKSLAGQVERVRRGLPYLMFGDGTLTACKPIGEADLARFVAECAERPDRTACVLPVGGPGPAITPREQGELLFELTGLPARFRRVPVGMFGVALGVLAPLGRVIPAAAAKAELARIGRYYATESMLVWDAGRGRYDAEATPSYGAETLRDFYARVLREGMAGQELGDHAVF